MATDVHKVLLVASNHAPQAIALRRRTDPDPNVDPALKALVRRAHHAPPVNNGPKVPEVTAPGAIADAAGDADAVVTRDQLVPRHPAHPRRPDA